MCVAGLDVSDWLFISPNTNVIGRAIKVNRLSRRVQILYNMYDS